MTKAGGVEMRNGLRMAALIAFGLLIPAAAHAQASVEVVTQDIIVSDTITNPCDGTGITLNGVIQFRLMTLFNASGGMEIEIHENNQGIQGVADSGDMYRFVGTSTLHLHIPDLNAAGQVFTLISESLLVGQGDAPNAHFMQFDHLVMHPEFTLSVA